MNCALPVMRVAPLLRHPFPSYGSGDFNPLRWVHNRRFDTAMVAFLDCLRQLMEYSRSKDPKVEFPQQ